MKDDIGENGEPEKTQEEISKAKEKEIEANGIENEKKNGIVPKDTLFLVHLLFFFLGLMHYIPSSFFTTATKYWMYKLRNTTYDDGSAQNRTYLQKEFGVYVTICSSVPLIFFSTLTTVYGHHIRPRPRITWSISVMLFTFVMSTIFVKVDTDSWQIPFFAISMSFIFVKSCANSVLGVSLFEVLSKFPQNYLKWYLTGEGIAGIFNSILQITSLAIGTSAEASALIYFICGSAVILGTLLLFIFAKYSPHYRYYVGEADEVVKKELLGWSESWDIIKQMWTSIATFVFMITGLQFLSPAITTLIVSEYDKGNPWSDTYFVPTITYLLNNVADLIGRTLASKIRWQFNVYFLTVVNLIRPCVLVPLYMVCNAYPRKHLPVLLPHDYQYAILVLSYGISGGYLFNVAFLNIKRLVKPEQVNKAYGVLATAIGIVGSTSSFLSSVAVDAL